MIALFKSTKKQESEAQIKAKIQQRAEINTEARRMAIVLGKQAEAEKSVANKKIALNKENMLQTLDSVLDSVSGYDNIKISTLCELYNALESNDFKNLITFLKKKEKVVVKKKKKLKQTWVL